MLVCCRTYYGQTAAISFTDEIQNSTGNSPDQAIEEGGTASFSWHDPITKIPKDIFGFGSEVIRTDNIKTSAALLTLTGVLVSIDRYTSEPFYRNYKSSSAIKEASNDISFLGGGEFHLVTAALLCGTGLIIGDNRTLRTGLQIIESELVCGLTVQLLKRVTGRESPQSATHPNGLFRPFPNLNEYEKNQPKYYSFPSGHISTTMAALTVITNNYPEIGWIKPAGYSLVGLIGVGLVTRGWHWLSDFPLALGIGYTFGKVITDRNLLSTGANKESQNFSVYPMYLDGPAIGINYSF